MTRKIITSETANTTPIRSWDYVAHYEGDCEDPEHSEPYSYGATPEEAIANFKSEHE